MSLSNPNDIAVEEHLLDILHKLGRELGNTEYIHRSNAFVEQSLLQIEVTRRMKFIEKIEQAKRNDNDVTFAGSCIRQLIRSGVPEGQVKLAIIVAFT